MKGKKTVLLLFFICIFFASKSLVAQNELVSISDPVYSYLKRMSIKGIIKNYNDKTMPMSRGIIASHIITVKKNEDLLSAVGKAKINYYLVQYEYDVYHEIKLSESIFEQFDLSKIFNDKKQKYFYYFLDDNVSFFVDGIGSLSYRNYNSNKKFDALIGEVGFRLRGTLYNSFSFSIKASNGKILTERNSFEREVIADYDKRLFSNPRFFDNGFYDSFEGYLRYQTNSNWFNLTLGRERNFQGTGYINSLMLTNSYLPLDYFQGQLNYKSLKYTFLYGDIKGDSLGISLKSKNIITHRLDLNLSDKLIVGLFETLIIADQPFKITYINPFSPLITSDLTGDDNSKDENNNFIGADYEYLLFQNFAFQGTLLIDDLNFETLGTDAHDNKFAYQFGLYWTDAFTISNLNLIAEFTHLDPYIYSHRKNKSTYTHWGLPIGHALPPNSDEIALKFQYMPHHRVDISLLFQHQRHAEGIEYDTDGNVIINYGGNLEEGRETPGIKFLDGNRIDRDIFTIDIRWEPIRQYYIDLHYQKSFVNEKYISKEYEEDIFYLTFSVDI